MLQLFAMALPRHGAESKSSEDRASDSDGDQYAHVRVLSNAMPATNSSTARPTMAPMVTAVNSSESGANAKSNGAKTSKRMAISRKPSPIISGTLRRSLTEPEHSTPQLDSM